VITSGSTGFGVGVGFAFQGAGGGGKSLTPWPWAIGVDRKRASTPIRNAGPKNFFSTPRIIFDTLRVCLMPPGCWPACFLSYRFSDGMIHDSLVPRNIRGVAREREPRAVHTTISYRNPRYPDSWSAPAT